MEEFVGGIDQVAARYSTTSDELITRGVIALLTDRLPLDRLTPRLISSIEAAAQLSSQMGYAHIGVEHLFLAALRNPDSIPAQLAAQEGVLNDVIQRLEEVITGQTYVSHDE